MVKSVEMDPAEVEALRIINFRRRNGGIEFAKYESYTMFLEFQIPTATFAINSAISDEL